MPLPPELSSYDNVLPDGVDDQVVRAHIVVFGLVHGEGAIGPDVIGLEPFVQMLQQKYKRETYSIFVHGLQAMTEEQRNAFFDRVERETGYVPFYDLDKTKKKFIQNLTPTEIRQPIAVVSMNDRHEIRGFMTLEILHNIQALLDIIGDEPYLAEMDNPDQVIRDRLQQLHDNDKLSFPVVFGDETAMLAEDVSEWTEMLGIAHEKIRNAGCHYFLAILPKSGKTYAIANSKGLLLDEFPLTSELIFTVQDFDKSDASLQRKLAERRS